jgi:hypothetical protein
VQATNPTPTTPITRSARHPEEENSCTAGTA